MQFSVILGFLLTLLNKREKVTRKYLAQKYELGLRTVSRYLDVIVGAGVPLEAESGINGGFKLPDTYKLDRSFFSKEELRQLFTCVSAMSGEFSEGQTRLLLDKISNMVKNKEDERYLLKSDTLVIDTGNWTNPQAYRNKIEVINKSIAEEFSLSITYIDRHDSKSERKIDPYCMVLKEGVWYLYGWCHLRRDFRLLKLSRIREMTISSNQFIRKPSDVYEKLAEVFKDAELIEIEIEFSSTILGPMEEWLGPEAIIDTGTKYLAAASVFGGHVLVNKLLSFGSSVRVLSPQALKEELLIECQRILRND